ncbi:GNAT family N-acetyltransferase [Streptomyces sp. SID2563]|nr:GNAT family N-acetyltransferase [Streptomyces sp. SID2563]MYW10169.1 GNAT family N-acetyltransferase [Streptomyces sp. SID2563]
MGGGAGAARPLGPSRKTLDGAILLGTINADTGEVSDQLHSAIVLRSSDAVEFVKNWPAEIAATEFCRPEWVLSAWNSLPELGKPAVAVVRDDDAWAAAALTEAGEPGAGTLTFAGQPLGDEHDLVLHRPDQAGELVTALVGLLEDVAAEGGKKVTLDALAPDGRLTRELRRSPRWALEAEAAPVITPALARVNAARHARRMRYLGGRGSLTFGVVTGDELTVTEGERFLRTRFENWTRQGRIDQLPAVERLPGFPHFMGTMMWGLAQRNMARLWVLELDGLRIAEDLHVGPPEDPLLYMRSYSTDFRKYSPGRILLEETLGQLAARDCARLRTGRGDELYKLDAGAGQECVLRAEFAPK